MRPHSTRKAGTDIGRSGGHGRGGMNEATQYAQGRHRHR